MPLKVNSPLSMFGQWGGHSFCGSSLKSHTSSMNVCIGRKIGTTVSMCAAEVRELAQGLEAIGHPFLWVLRYADKGNIFAGGEAEDTPGLPEGYEKRVRGRGLIVRDWAPQLKILRHPSTGGFMTHCGWNSCMESISMGVPMVAWPMHSDQPVNAQLVTGVLGVGVAVKE
ncbi:hypothetical protein AMTRI_Chr07g77050 [Amborella trichopoda]